MELNSVVLSSDNPDRLVEFYTKVIGQEPQMKGEPGQFSGWMVGNWGLAIGPDDRIHGASKEPMRVMFNFTSQDVPGDFNRIKAAGATVIAEPYTPGGAPENADMQLATFADPDGNYFQLASPMKM